MEKLHIHIPIVVEGKYDKIRLQQFIDGVIIVTNGFRIFKDCKKKEMIKSLSKDGIVIITDSDRAGFVIRNYLKSFLPPCNIINLYIPQLIGKEKRKYSPSKENFLGVEGISENVLKELFINSGVLKSNGCANNTLKSKNSNSLINKAIFFEDGLIGKDNSSKLRQLLLNELSLPSYLTTNSLLNVINNIITIEEYKKILTKIKQL